MRVEHHGIAGRHDVDDIAGQSRDRVCRRGHRADHAERGVLLERDSVVAATAVRAEPLDSRHVTDDVQLLDLVIETANLGFLQLDATPFIGVGLAHALDDLDDFAPGLDALFAQLEERPGRSVAGIIRILEHTKVLAAAFATATAGALVFAGRRSGGSIATQPPEDVLDHVADQCFIHCIRHVESFNLGFTSLAKRLAKRV